MADQGAGDRHQHPGLAGEDAAARGHRRVHPLERENEERARKDVDVIDQGAHYFFSSLRLNILSMRSVIRKPETMLVVAAVMATKPSTLLIVVASSLLMIRIAPTTEMAEMALVSDISGVCRRGETLRMTSRPTKVANMKTYNPISRFEGIALSLYTGAGSPSSSRTFGWTTSPACVTSVSRTISSFSSSR